MDAFNENRNYKNAWNLNISSIDIIWFTEAIEKLKVFQTIIVVIVLNLIEPKISDESFEF